MRQLEMIVGEQRFRDGLREYLKRYAFGNATWLDLIRILDARTPENLAAWSRAWVEERGRPEFTTDVARRRRTTRIAAADDHADGSAAAAAWCGRSGCASRSAMPDGRRQLAVYATARATTVVREAAGMPRPLFVLPNGGGLGYGLFVLDDESRRLPAANMSRNCRTR